MTTFVLVHGGFQGGWSFRALARLLQKAGHEVFTPTLTGLGERSHLVSLPINLDTHIDDIVNLVLWEELNDIVLLGHSYGGMVITGVADRIPTRISRLVYMDALVPKDGETLLMIREDLRDLFLILAANNGGSWIDPFPAYDGEARPAYHGWLNAKTVPHPFACFTQALKLGGGLEHILDRHYIYAENGWFGPHYEAFRGSLGATVDAVRSSGHSIHIDQPELMAALLVRAAN